MTGFRPFVLALCGSVLLAGSALSGVHAGNVATTHAIAMSMASMTNPAARQWAHRPRGVVLLHRRVVRVTIHNFAFVPAYIVVSPGTRIVWTNTDSDPHTVDSTKALWASEALDTGNRFARTFTTVGTFPYYCSVHSFMHGTIVVTRDRVYKGDK